MLFKRLSDHENIDLIEYVRNAINVDEQVRIYIGTDSHNRGNATVYGTVVVIHYGNRGGHVIYYKESVPKIKDTFSRLWKEVDLSVRVAEMLKENGIEVSVNNDMLAGDYKIIWCNGFLERNATEVASQIEGILTEQINKI